MKVLLANKNKYLHDHTKASVDIVLRDLTARANKLNVDKFIEFSTNDRNISLIIDQEEINKASELDGCYCLITDIPSSEANKEVIHARYKDLSMVESAFRTMKQSHLEIRPVYLRREDRTKAHVFVTMLAFMIEKRLSEYWKKEKITVTEGLAALSTLTTTTISIAGAEISKVTTPTGVCKKLLDAVGVIIPRRI